MGSVVGSQGWRPAQGRVHSRLSRRLLGGSRRRHDASTRPASITEVGLGRGFHDASLTVTMAALVHGPSPLYFTGDFHPQKLVLRGPCLDDNTTGEHSSTV